MGLQAWMENHSNVLGVGKEELEQLKGRRTKESQGHEGDLESS